MTEGRNVWLAVVAVVALGLGVVALVIGLNAKSTSDDAATQAELEKVQRKAVKQGSAQKKAEKGLKGEERAQAKKQAEQEKRQQSEAASVSKLSKQLAVQKSELRRLTTEVDNLKERVANLQKTKKNK